MLFSRIYIYIILLDNSLVKIVNESIFENENKINANETCEIYMNDIVEETFEENPNVEAKIQKVKMNKI